MSTNQSSSCVTSFPYKIGISCIKLFVKFVCFGAEHRVSVYCFNTSSRGSGGADDQSDMDSLCNSCSMSFRASDGCTSHASIYWHKSSNYLVMNVSLVGLLGSDSSKSFVFTWWNPAFDQYQYLQLCEHLMSPYKGCPKPPWQVAIACVL